MTENIATQYIDEIAERYQIADKDRAKLESNQDQITKELGQYAWGDIRSAIAEYFRTKSDKHRPTLAQIVALLESNPNIHKIGAEPALDTYHLPRTQLWTIKDAFDRVIKAMVMCEILAPENPMDKPLRPGYSLLEADNLPMINPKRRLRAMVTAAKNRRPDIFAQYKSLSFWEELAVALQNGLVRLRMRDWYAFHAGLPEDIKSVIRNRGSNTLGETSERVNRMIAAWPGAATVGVLEV